MENETVLKVKDDPVLDEASEPELIKVSGSSQPLTPVINPVIRCRHFPPLGPSLPSMRRHRQSAPHGEQLGQLRFDFDTTAIRLLFDCNSTAL